ncbi:MAG TPA: ATP-dependent zinc metalloprotease FtsH [Candidatus Dependentiae bacterium]|nr:ATP-dependent zinc metalloprotease FtsH [Candidatus Dependentiae bacterium]HRQ62605.1 ATP-dependent zinc metalloprotease FtsH [Candidatus Dependentiae bacterium]
MKKKQTKSWGNTPKNILIAALIFVGSLYVLHQLTEQNRTIQTMSYSQFLDKVEQAEVRGVRISGQDVYGVLKDGTHFETVIGTSQKDWDLLREHNVEMVVSPSTHTLNLWYFLPLLPLLLLLGWGIFFFMRQSRGGSNGGGAGNIFSMGKSRAKLFMPSTIKETFNSVAGVTEAKEELKDVVDFLKNPQKYKRMGAKIPRGVLLVGEPGNGKTLLARAVAGEATCPFFSISGSDFIEVFVGVGAARVRDLFAQARKHAPCIVFIDEIDAVGRHRGSGLGGGHDEREQTLNQLLTEMDGFQTNEAPVIVLAATNRVDVLDKALLRPGRFDRHVDVPYPDVTSREQILRVHAQHVKVDSENVDLKKIAQGTPGFSGADLANLINEAAIIASKREQGYVTIEDFEEARDKIMLGKELKTIVLTENDKKVTAYHEAGHALVRLLMPEHTDPLHKVTIIPRGRALGVTHYLPEREKHTSTKDEMLASIASALGGRAAEELVFDSATTGAYSDFQVASKIARAMVCNYGMSAQVGPIIYGQSNQDFVYSQKTAEQLDAEVKNIIDMCYTKACDLLRSNRDKLDALSQALLEKETMYAGEIYVLLGIEPRTEHKLS